jgi:hypothetical protein
MRALFRAFLALTLALSIYPAAADQPAKPAPDAGAKPGQMQMSVVMLTVMIKDAIIALNQANRTGNYSVLRDMGTPVFRENFDQTALAAVFANLRARKIDMSPAFFLSPNLTKQPELNKDSELALTGFFPTQPLQIQFDLRYMQLDGKWRLAGIGVDATPAPQAQASAAASQAQAPAPAPAAAPAPAPAPTQQAAAQNGGKNTKKASEKPKPEKPAHQ